MKNYIQEILFPQKKEKLRASKELIQGLILVEEFIGEKFISLIRFIAIFSFVLVYIVSPQNFNFSPSFRNLIFSLLFVQFILAFLSKSEKVFSRTWLYFTIIIDAFSIMLLIYFFALSKGYQNMINSDAIAYIQILFIVIQVIRISPKYVITAAALLLFTRVSVFIYFFVFHLEQITFEGGIAIGLMRLILFFVLIAIVLYTSSRMKRVAGKAIEEYLLKNNLMQKNEELLRLAIVDGLTNLYIPRYFHLRLKLESERAARKKRQLSLLLIDIDFFKNVNDKFGHTRGDDVLKTVASLLRSSTRSYDILARYGGDELAVILPDTDLKIAGKVAERSRKKIESHYSDKDEDVSISVGVACFKGQGMHSESKLLEQADKALYEAKEAGRNTVKSFKTH